jgi:hypothetical protein
VFPEGAGSTCESAVPLERWGARPAPVTATPPGCTGAPARGSWFALPGDLPVRSLSVYASSSAFVAVQDGCDAGAVPTCASGSSYAWSNTSTMQHPRIFVAPTASSPQMPPSVSISGSLELGDRCDPNGSLQCPYSCRLDGGSGVYLCAPPACSDGLDNDSNGVADWPDDPGCYAPDLDEEQAPETAPRCADLFASHPACGAACSGSEYFCEPEQGQLSACLGNRGLPAGYSGRIDASTPDRFAGTCGGAGGGDLLYEFTAPRAGQYSFDAWAKYLYVRRAGCQGEEIVCSTNGHALATLAAGETVAIIVDSSAGESRSFNLSVAPSEEGFCTDGEDNDGDGYVDCNDGDCSSDPACYVPPPME